MEPERWKVSIHGMVTVIATPIEPSHMAVCAKPAKPFPDGSFLRMEMGERGHTILSPGNSQLVFSVTEREEP